jgi:hypothetical protein
MWLALSAQHLEQAQDNLYDLQARFYEYQYKVRLQKIEKQAYQRREGIVVSQLKTVLMTIHTFLHRLFGLKTGFFCHSSISLQVIYV